MNKYDINNPRPLPSQERINQLLSYDFVTGELTWKFHPNRTDLIGKVCNNTDHNGYLYVSIDGHKYKAHRVIYKLVTNQEPKIIDHINGVENDNRFHNLRSVTPQENNRNSALPKDNKSGAIGVFYHETQQMWHASVRVDGKTIHLGSCKTKQEAIDRREGANKVLGFTERHGDIA